MLDILAAGRTRRAPAGRPSRRGLMRCATPGQPRSLIPGLVRSARASLAQRPLLRAFFVPARVLIGQKGSCIDPSCYCPSHTLRTPASRELGDSRRAPTVRRYVRAFQDRRDVRGRASRGCPPDVTALAPSVPSGVAGTQGVVCTNSGGLRPGRIQRPAARTRSGGSGEAYNGRSRRWRCPCGGIGGATAYPPAARAGARRHHGFSEPQ
jgi:hypothetical protein